jgi:hypothetical protein
MGFVWLSLQTAIVSLNIDQLIFVMLKCSVLFEVQTEFLSIIYTVFRTLLLSIYSTFQASRASDFFLKNIINLWVC